MKLYELEAEDSGETRDMCALMALRGHHEPRPLSITDDGQEVVIVVNEEGLAEYRIKGPDGHLGAVEW